MSYLKCFQHLFLLYDFWQLVVFTWHPHQHAIVVFSQVEEVQPSRTGQQGAIVVVSIPTEFVIHRIKVADGLHEFHLGTGAPLLEDFGSLIYRTLMPHDAHVVVDEQKIRTGFG